MKNIIIDKNNKNLKLCRLANASLEYLYHVEPILKPNNLYECVLEADNLTINLDHPIRFTGDLSVYGNIDSKHTIFAEKIYCEDNITVQGHIYCKYINCENDITASKLIVFGNIKAKNINTVLSVESFGNISVQNEIKTSSIKCDSLDAKTIKSKEINGEDMEDENEKFNN